MLMPETLPARTSKEPFPRMNGIVDLECYLPYLVDEAEEVPVRPNTTGNDAPWVHQHVYFTEYLYRQKHIPDLKQRDMRLVELRNSPYSQIIMRPAKEREVHMTFEDYVEPPQERALEGIIADYRDLNIVAATTLGIRLIKHPKTLPAYLSDIYKSPSFVIPAEDRVGIFEEQRGLALKSLEQPRVADDMLVASALMRISKLIKDRSIRARASEQITNGNYYPLSLPKLGNIRDFGNIMLMDICSINELDVEEKLAA